MTIFKSDSFLDYIDDSALFWNFKIIGGLKVKGRVLDYRSTPFGVPILLKIFVDEDKTFEIPWTSIQAISKPRVQRKSDG